jgi:tetratricopeptide (TPR) repeat protein
LAVNDFVNDDLLSQASTFQQEEMAFAPNPNLTVRELLDRATERIGSRFEKQPLVEARIRYTIGEAYADNREDLKAESQLTRALELQRKAVGNDHPDTLGTMWALVSLYRSSERNLDAIQCLEDQQRWQVANLGLNHPHTLATATRLGQIYWRAGRANDAIKALERVREQVTALLGASHPNTLNIAMNLAIAYGKAGRRDEEIQLLEQLCSPLGSNADPETAQIAAKVLGETYLDLGRTADAINLFERARDEGIKRLGPREVLITMQDLAAAYSAAGRKKEALDVLDNVVLQYSQLLAKHPLDSARWHERSRLLGRLGRFDEAAEGFRKAVSLQPDNPTYWHTGLLPTVLQAGDLPEFQKLRSQELLRFKGTRDTLMAHRVSKFACLIPIAGEELQITEELADCALGSDHPEWGAQSKGMAEYRAGRYPEAIKFLTQSTQAPEWAYSRTTADLLLSMCHDRLGDHAQATATLNRTTEKMDHEFSKPGVDDLISFQDWILCQVLRREAEGLINGGNAPATGPAASTPISGK